MKDLIKYTEIEMQDAGDIQLISIKQALIELNLDIPWSAGHHSKIGDISIETLISKIALGDKVYEKALKEKIMIDKYDDNFVYPRGWLKWFITSFFARELATKILETL